MTFFSAIRRFLSTKRFHHRVETNDAGLVDKSSNNETIIRWSEVTRIYGTKVDKVTYDENFLVIESENNAISIGELDKNFTLILRDIGNRFPSIQTDWMSLLEGGETNRIDLWQH